MSNKPIYSEMPPGQIKGTVRIKMFRAEDYDGYMLRIALDRPDGTYLAEPIQLKFNWHKPGDYAPATLMFDNISGYEFLKAMADCLLATGFGVDALNERSSELKATKFHLEDMRRLVFKGKIDG